MLSVAELNKIEWEMTKARGGYWAVTEGDWWQNKISRNLVRAYRRENGQCFLGRINLHTENKDKPILEEYTSGRIYNFGADFAVPEANKELITLIEQYRGTSFTSGKYIPALDAVMDKIQELKGINLRWV